MQIALIIVEFCAKNRLFVAARPLLARISTRLRAIYIARCAGADDGAPGPLWGSEQGPKRGDGGGGQEGRHAR